MGLVVQMRVVLVIKTLLRGPMAKLMGEKDTVPGGDREIRSDLHCVHGNKNMR